MTKCEGGACAIHGRVAGTERTLPAWLRVGASDVAPCSSPAPTGKITPRGYGLMLAAPFIGGIAGLIFSMPWLGVIVGGIGGASAVLAPGSDVFGFRESMECVNGQWNAVVSGARVAGGEAVTFAVTGAILGAAIGAIVLVSGGAGYWGVVLMGAGAGIGYAARPSGGA